MKGVCVMIVFLFSYMAITPLLYPPTVYLEPAPHAASSGRSSP